MRIPTPSKLPAAGSFMNLTMTIALYAAICKEQGLPFRCAFTSELIKLWTQRT